MHAINPTYTRIVSPSGWLESALGALLLVSPWLFGFGDVPSAVATHVAVGGVAMVAGALTAGVHRGFSWLNVIGGGVAFVVAASFTYPSAVATATGIVLGLMLAVAGIGNGPRRFRA